MEGRRGSFNRKACVIICRIFRCVPVRTRPSTCVEGRGSPVGITSLLPCGAPGLNLGALGYLTCPIGFGIGSHAAQAGPELGVSVLGLEVCAVSGWLGWHVGTTFGQLGKTGRFLGMVGWPARFMCRTQTWHFIICVHRVGRWGWGKILMWIL